MVRTTITLPEELLKRLKHIAAERNVPMAVVIREALEEKVAEEALSSDEALEPKERPKLSFLGIRDSGHTDTSELAGDPSGRPTTKGKAVRKRPRLSFAGIGASGDGDIARRSGEERPGIRDWR